MNGKPCISGTLPGVPVICKDIAEEKPIQQLFSSFTQIQTICEKGC